ncbi:MAG: DUF1569 domain-containing protein [Gemmataceae bacterium]|nr:DUF1569 domain-containing protein [Gemmataceae bacterium]
MRRQLEFHSFHDVRNELDRLRKNGYTKLGTWDLAQACEHLTFFVSGPMDGHPYKVPWLLKTLFGRMVLKRILSGRQMKNGVPTPQKPLPAPGGDEAAAIDRLKSAIARLEAHQGPWHDSPFFGHLTPEQWRELQLIHCQHHLGFFEPR